MQLFYSGARSANAIQPYSWLSLGMYISSSAIKSNIKNSFFNDVTLSDVKNKKEVYRLIVLKNTTNATKTDVKFYVEKTTDCICKFEAALVEPALDACNNPVFENIMAEEEAPLTAVFANCETLANAATISSIAAGASIGIWIKRLIDDENTNYFDSDKNFKLDTCQILFDATADASNFYNKKIDTFSIKIDY